MRFLSFFPVFLSFLLMLPFQSKSQSLPSIEDTIHPETWLTAGPFPSGARESATDALYEHGGFGNISPKEGLTHSSFLYNEGEVTWQKDTVNDEGVLEIEHDDAEPDWDQWLNYKGRTFISSSNYAWTEFEVEEESRALMAGRAVGSFRINGKSYSGDFYNHGYLNVPVKLEEGKNEILLGLSGRPGSEAYLALVPLEKDLKVITEDLTGPHLVRGKNYSTLDLGMPLSNTTNEWQKDVKVSVKYLKPGGDTYLLSEKNLPAIGPRAYQHSAHRLDFDNSLNWEPLEGQDSLPIRIEVASGDQTFEFESELQIQEKGEPYNVTFRDSDESVQFYSVFPPENPEEGRDYSAILTLHGAGVDATGSNGYTQKDWAYVIAPTNRREYGFNWEQQGRINGLNALDDALKNLPIDEDRVYLSGHSMGGHGSYVFGTGFPHRFAALAPSAAWTSIDIYTPFITRQDHLHGSPESLELLKSGLQPTRTLSMAENLKHLPTYILQGGEDQSVPPEHARMFNQRLKDLGYEVTYNEVSGKEHWWSFEDTEGTDCVDHEEIMDFFRGRERKEAPKNIRFRTAGLSESHEAYWASVKQRKDFKKDSYIEVSVKEKQDGDDEIWVKTSNIKRFELNLEEAPIDPETAKLFVNEEEMALPESISVIIDLEDRELEPGEPVPENLKKPEKAGPIRQAFYDQFVLVFATRGGEEWQEQTYEQARSLAHSWYYRGNGKTKIIPDTAVNEEIQREYDLILFGSPQANAYYGEIQEDLPVRIYDDRVEVGKVHAEELSLWDRMLFRDKAEFGEKEVYEQDLAAKFIYPNPQNGDRFVQVNGGRTLESQELSTSFSMLSSADALPDYLLFDDLVEEKSFAGLLNAGYFDNRWRYDYDQAFIQPSVLH